YMNYDLSDLQHRLDGLRAVPMRMELKEGINNCQVIDDTYNNDLGGLELALQFLTNQHQKKKKRLIISDILESGLDDEELLRNITAIIHRHRIDAIVGIGRILRKLESRHGENIQYFPTTQDFLIRFDFTTLHDEIILVKGARKFLFERIVSRLQRKVHGTIMEIDLDALIHNFNFFKSLLKPATKVMVMVKAFAYGSGSTEIANLLQYHQADYLGVAYADEGIELRKNNITLPIMVMNPSEESFESLLAYALEPEIYSLRIIQLLVKFLSGRPCSVHIKIDTGMHRLGFENSMLDELLVLLRANPAVRVASIFTHLAGADERRHDNFSSQQYSNFLEAADIITRSLGYRPLYHALNTPGILRLPAYQLDMVRLGIGLYGVDPTENEGGQLKPVATLKSIISQVKTIRKGETIGYGRAGLAATDTTIATIALGYADGYSRAFSGGVGEVLVNGKLSKVIGNVCMDMTMIDVTGLEANEGDEVTIFGRELPIQIIAAKIDTIPYEILTSTSERVKRVFITNGI
ncbi:MAG TPA: alanine racemase, partial [Chryseolinea sp.]|nr:alanine racemase [Chryseolinea sp.]